MVVYVELAILNNFIISLVLLLLTKKVAKAQTKTYRIILSCLFSSAISLVLPLITIHAILMMFIKLLIGFLCVVIAFKCENIKRLIKYSLIYFGLTFAFAGLIYAAFTLLNLKLSEASFANSPFIIAILVIYVLLFAFIFNVIKLCKVLYKHKQVGSFLYKVKITLGGKTSTTHAFLDSGNRLKDAQTGEGVNIVTFSFLSSLLSQADLNAIAMCEPEKFSLPGAHFVEYSSVGASNQKLFVFNADQIELEENGKFKKLNSTLIGVVFKKFKDSIDYEVLLSGEAVSALK